MTQTKSKVLFITKSDLSGTAGHNIATREIVTALARSDRINLTVVCPAPADEYPSGVDEAISNRIYLSERSDTLSLLQRGFGIFDGFRTLGKAIREVKPDLLLGRMNSVFIAAPVLAQYYDVPYGLFSRGTSYKSLRFSSVLTQLYKYNVRVADEVYVASNEIKQDTDQLRKSEQSSATFLPNGVTIEQFEPIDRERARSAIGFERDDLFVVGFVGSMKPYHRVDYLIKSLNHIEPSKNIALLLIGDGPERDRYRKQAEEEGVAERVVFPGFVPHSEVGTYISACDVLYGVSDQDSATPIKIFEYLACARPVIARNIDELSVITDRNLGRLVRRDPAAIGTAIEELYETSQAERHSMGTRGRAYVEQNRTWDAAVDRVLDDFF